MMNNILNKENKDTMAMSMAMLDKIRTSKVLVKPVLPEGHYSVIFKGIGFEEASYRGIKCMSVQFKYGYNNLDYEENIPLNPTTSPEAQQMALVQIQNCLRQLAEQFNLIGVEVDVETLNKYVGNKIDIKIYRKEFEFLTVDGETKIGHSRKFGFWKKPVEVEVEVTPVVEMPKF